MDASMLTDLAHEPIRPDGRAGNRRRARHPRVVPALPGGTPDLPIRLLRGPHGAPVSTSWRLGRRSWSSIASTSPDRCIGSETAGYYRLTESMATALRYLWKVGSTPTVWAHRRRLSVGPKQRSCWRARLAKPQCCAAESTVGRTRHHREPPECYLPKTEVVLARRPDVWFDASSSEDPPMQKSPTFGIASQLTRHCVTPACAVPGAGIWSMSPTCPASCC